jgi:hypothetical protein
MGFDDYDFQIFAMKQIFLMQDSQLYFSELFILDSAKYFYKRMSAEIKTFQKTSKSLVQALKKLKRAQSRNERITKRYDSIVQEYDLLISDCLKDLGSFDKMLNDYVRRFRQVEKGAKKTEKRIVLELQVEYDKSPYKARIRAHKRLSKDLIRETRRLMRKTERKIQKLN